MTAEPLRISIGSARYQFCEPCRRFVLIAGLVAHHASPSHALSERRGAP